MIPLELSDMAQTVRDEAVDFVIVNPGAYIELSLEHGISTVTQFIARPRGWRPVMTMKNSRSLPPPAVIKTSSARMSTTLHPMKFFKT